MSTQFNIITFAGKLLAAGYDVNLASDGWLVVVGNNWEAWFSPNDGNDVTWGDVPQEVFDLAE